MSLPAADEPARAGASAARRLPSGRDVRVCFVGDSFVAGTGDETARGWVGRVAEAAIADGIDLTTYNLGVRGATSVQVARRLAIEARPRLTTAEDPRIVVSFGVNDTLPDSAVVIEQTLDALREAVRRVAPIPLLLVGPPAVADEEQNDRIRILEAALGAEASRLGVPFVPVFAATEADPVWRTPVRDGDGYHPDGAGYTMLAALVTEPLVAWLASPA